MMHSKDMAEEKRQILDAYRGDRSLLLDLFTRLESKRPSSQKPHEARWRNGGSLWVNLRRATFKDHEADVGGNVIDAVIHNLGYDYRGAVDYLRNHLGWPVDAPLPKIDEEKRRRRQEADLAAEEEARASEAENLAKAQRLWSVGRHISGTPGQVYLETTRAIGPQQWDTSFVRWHDAGRMLMFAATTDAGNLCGIQRIAVTLDGQKDLRWRVGKEMKAKLSLGPVARGVVRLPGNGVERGLGEGPETCLSAWAASRYETWIALGSRIIKPPPGRRVIYLRDDDKRNPKTERKRRELLRGWRNEGLSFIDATPFVQRREKKQDFNDLLIEQGLDAVRERVNLFAREPDAIASLYEPLDAVRSALDKTVGPIVAEFAGWTEESGTPAPVYAIKITVGGGKTFAALVNIIRMLKEMRAKGDKRVFVVAVPYHDLGENLARDFVEIPGHCFKAGIWRGREARRLGGVDKDDRMCGRVDDVRLAQKLRVKVGEELCKSCLLRDECSYLAQRSQDPDVWFVAHQTLGGQVPAAIGKDRIAGLVVDETSWLNAAFTDVEIPLARLEPGAMPTSKGDALNPLGGDRHEEIRSKLKLAAEMTGSGPIPKAVLASVGFCAETGLDGVKMEGYRVVTDGPWRDRHQNRTVGPMMAAWLAVADLMASEQFASGRLVVGRNEDNESVLFVSGKIPIHADWQKPALVIDASADPDMLRLFWPGLEMRGEFTVDAPHMRVHQVTGRAFSKTMLAPLDGDPLTEEGRKLARYKANSLRNLRAFIYKTARRNGGRTLVVANEVVKRALKEHGLPPGVETLHFNALVGRNDFSDVRSLIVIGRTQPRPDHVEALAAALTGEVIEPLPGWYPTRDAVRLHRRAGELVPVIGETVGHPNATVEKIRRRICEGEVEQAVGRCRGVARTAADPCDVYILSDVAIELPIDAFIDADEILTPTPLDLMLSAGGIAFADGSSASEAYRGRGLWPTPGAARIAFMRQAERQRCVTLPKEDISLGNVTDLVPVTFQKTGAGQKPQRAWIDAGAVSDPRQTIEAMLGPLVRFEVIEPVEAAELGDFATSIAHARTREAAPLVVGSLAIAAEPEPEVIVAEVPPLAPQAQPESLVEVIEPDPPPLPWGEVWNLARDAGLSHAEVAEAWFSMSIYHASHIEAGRRKPPPALARAMARFLAEVKPRQECLF